MPIETAAVYEKHPLLLFLFGPVPSIVEYDASLFSEATMPNFEVVGSAVEVALSQKLEHRFATGYDDQRLSQA